MSVLQLPFHCRFAHGLSNTTFLCGFISKNALLSYYKNAEITTIYLTKLQNFIIIINKYVKEELLL
ncbi:hypothetical protein HMPREF1148_0960 [Selenomonas sp. FOBRC6]|nr:hypothetical protein HMPREF1148_0960 [Selenomonas sp. FOBRC6]